MESNAGILIATGSGERGRRYASYLRPTYEVETATSVAGARAALDRLGDRDGEDGHSGVDVVLADDTLPDGSGEEILRAVRDRGYSARAAVFTPDVPSRDVAERGFDEYLLTPVADDELLAAVDRLLDLRVYDAKLRESAALASERASLLTRAADDPDADAGDARYAWVSTRLDQLEEELRTIGGRFEATGYRAAFRDIGNEQ